MNSRSDNKLSPKEYLFLVVCLIIFFTVSIYLLGGEAFPKGTDLIINGVGIVVAIPIVISMLKNMQY
ncbi:hypothetical protein FF125_06830 [Aureibaculum algae]|uniref:Uncharacterized protein n=1 Tax=Aureibaculum algae TaxID=2584122 RepID=A0A5B7TSQ8_9FLAO|nr:hypothetical protein [Aureibaculum algae]QCX38156.1 hypothetical protein FF125_06830 [Aureibaculum algae]